MVIGQCFLLPFPRDLWQNIWNIFQHRAQIFDRRTDYSDQKMQPDAHRLNLKEFFKVSSRFFIQTKFHTIPGNYSFERTEWLRYKLRDKPAKFVLIGHRDFKAPNNGFGKLRNRKHTTKLTEHEWNLLEGIALESTPTKKMRNWQHAQQITNKQNTCVQGWGSSLSIPMLSVCVCPLQKFS